MALHSMCQPGPAAAPRGLPAHVAIGLVPRFPEREIADALLFVLVIADAAGGTQLFEVSAPAGRIRGIG